MEIILWIFCAVLLIIPIGVFWFLTQDSKKVYKVVWRYDVLCSPTAELIKAKDPYDAWRKVKKQHAISIDLIEITEI